MNTAHASLLEWLQRHPNYSIRVHSPAELVCKHWLITQPNTQEIGTGSSYEAACHNLMIKLRRLGK